ncbi:hypothetical protein F2Q65_17555 [Thiohalocapsa marina]|uniref:HNH nuclease domain-containing protein n=1 Tax=Thiohalocapsa marina TaxID=424902 RepID=A0A5M8FJF0_9GAMM|nr:HNH endonuclease domain-containing protein [Thiohalocapsa marina]KAA6182605.1 hypothetical protein F2Q65_17555 [Thiohalocapsa marina]
MVAAGQPLPDDAGLNIAALSRLFQHTTNSYKFVFFLALLDLLARHRFDAERPYTYAEITIEMLSIAWFAHTYFKLSFGAQDTIAKKLDALDLALGDAETLTANDRKRLRAALGGCDLGEAARLMDFVPYRLQIPFLTEHLQGVDKGAWMVFERAMPAITNAHFATARPLYRYDSDDWKTCASLRWHPDWVAYLERHFSIIHGWAAWHWLQYMQRRNPATPAIATKLFPPAKRESLSGQTRYWREILRQAPAGLRCIYSDQPLTPEAFALDHYLPWSFVAHDQLWNLIPVPREVNSSKSNKLPDGDYFRDFVDFQYAALQIAKRAFPERQFERFAEDYLADLHLTSVEALLSYGELYRAYDQTIGPLMTLAANQGFTPGWHYES